MADQGAMSCWSCCRARLPSRSPVLPTRSAAVTALQKLPIAALKIDRGFVRHVVDNDDDAVIVRAVINLAHSLQKKVVAEGAETLEQVQFLWQNRCDQVQGYYFSPAVPLGQLEAMLLQRAVAVM